MLAATRCLARAVPRAALVRSFAAEAAGPAGVVQVRAAAAAWARGRAPRPGGRLPRWDGVRGWGCARHLCRAPRAPHLAPTPRRRAPQPPPPPPPPAPYPPRRPSWIARRSRTASRRCVSALAPRPTPRGSSVPRPSPSPRPPGPRDASQRAAVPSAPASERLQWRVQVRCGAPLPQLHMALPHAPPTAHPTHPPRARVAHHPPRAPPQVLKNFEKVDAAKVTPVAHFSNDLGLDSLDAVEVCMALEEEFVITVRRGGGSGGGRRRAASGTRARLAAGGLRARVLHTTLARTLARATRWLRHTASRRPGRPRSEAGGRVHARSLAAPVPAPAPRRATRPADPRRRGGEDLVGGGRRQLHLHTSPGQVRRRARWGWCARTPRASFAWGVRI